MFSAAKTNARFGGLTLPTLHERRYAKRTESKKTRLLNVVMVAVTNSGAGTVDSGGGGAMNGARLGLAVRLHPRLALAVTLPRGSR